MPNACSTAVAAVISKRLTSVVVIFHVCACMSKVGWAALKGSPLQAIAGYA